MLSNVTQHPAFRIGVALDLSGGQDDIFTGAILGAILMEAPNGHFTFHGTNPD
ncbi:MAG: hypothetical protein ISP39_02840 [Alphaproteobacteria bacterium]|nr:hypothetical protein [Alphaproteobacteria bacterium]